LAVVLLLSALLSAICLDRPADCCNHLNSFGSEQFWLPARFVLKP